MLITPTPTGEFDKRVTILTKVTGPTNGLGETNPTTAAARTIWAKVTPISGTERYVNAQNTANVTHEIRCYYVNYIDHACTLTMDGGKRTFDLVSVIDVKEQHIELVMLAQEVKR